MTNGSRHSTPNELICNGLHITYILDFNKILHTYRSHWNMKKAKNFFLNSSFYRVVYGYLKSAVFSCSASAHMFETSVNFYFSACDQRKLLRIARQGFKDRVHCFSMQVVINKCFLLNPKKNFGADSSCRFRQKCKKRTFNSEKWHHWAEG